ncbi:MAG: hypothetical protein FJZ58_05435, partial [Chlamydiae bacterium]|nr:hypothetical protein [Chlamydiota bacterium]
MVPSLLFYNIDGDLMISSMYELQTNSLIGEGVYGRIFAIKKPLMKHVAVKIPNGAIYAASLWNEAKILISLQKQ